MLKTFSLTDIGKKRTMNQDYTFTSETPVGNLPNLFIVADGMGGYNGGGFASCYTVEVITKVIKSLPDTSPRKLFEEAINTANTEIRRKASEDEDLNGMGTTVVMCSVIGNVLQVANVGDSRLYIAGDDIRQITVDHSYVEEMVRMGALLREEARTHEKKNIITRAVGADDSITADYFTVKLKENDIILMCSDGLTNMVEDSEILNIIKRGRDIADMAEGLVNAANENGGKDNIGVVVINPFASKD